MKKWRKWVFIGCLSAIVLLIATGKIGTLKRGTLTPVTTGNDQLTVDKPGTMDRNATSTITTVKDEFGNEFVRTTNRRFSYIETYPVLNFDKSRWLLLLEEFRSEFAPGIEGTRATITVDGWVGEFTNPQKKIWTIRSEGDLGKAYDNFYKVTRYGCCAAISTDIWFSLIDGQKVFTSNIDPVRVIVPNSKADLTRYFAWHSSEASISPVELNTKKYLIGVLQYGSERKVTQRFLVRSQAGLFLSKVAFRYQGKLHDERRDLESGLMLWGVDGHNSRSALSNFSIVLTFDDKVEAEIFVENDELQISKAKVPAEIILEAAK